MGTITLLLGIHNHQPQGNFEHVFARGFEDCYQPLLDAIERHPGIRMAMHYSGPLLEWIEANRSSHIDKLARLSERGQVEVLGGAFYEPMISVLPERDAIGQLALMADYVEDRFGRRPEGMWLAERVWEPDLARVIGAAGYRYTLLDDRHFLGAGLQRPLHGHFVTDKAAQALALFPIVMDLRYAVPFRPVDETIDLLDRMADEADGDRVITYGDDGEKFGMWPNTKEWVWGRGWLDRFFERLERHDRVQTRTFSQVLRERTPRGRVYLPTSSYDEMGEWALPTEAQPRLHELKQAIDEHGQRDRWGAFVRGGIWQGFLAKYPEANFMHKRMCETSRMVAAAVERASGDSALEQTAREATRELYRGQCNCAYWHGLFGGLYLGKLRSAVHEHLLRADRLASTVLGRAAAAELDVRDIDADLCDELLVRTPALGAVVAPRQGGALLAIDDRRRDFCVTDVLSRRPEGYHHKIAEAAAGNDGSAGAPQSIHDIVALKDDRLSEILLYDAHQRLAFVDHFLDANAALERLSSGRVEERGDFVDAPYVVERTEERGRVNVGLRRAGCVTANGTTTAVDLHKELDFDADRLRVIYGVRPAHAIDRVSFACELALALPCGPHEDARLRWSDPASATTAECHVAQAMEARGVSRIEMVDPHRPFTIMIEASPAATVVAFPLETASQSESGIERTYQGTVLTFVWAEPLRPDHFFAPKIELRLM